MTFHLEKKIANVYNKQDYRSCMGQLCTRIMDCHPDINKCSMSCKEDDVQFESCKNTIPASIIAVAISRKELCVCARVILKNCSTLLKPPKNKPSTISPLIPGQIDLNLHKPNTSRMDWSMVPIRKLCARVDECRKKVNIATMIRGALAKDTSSSVPSVFPTLNLPSSRPKLMISVSGIRATALTMNIVSDRA